MSNHFRLLRPIAVLITGIGLAVLALTTSFADEPISRYVRQSPTGADSVIVFVHGIRGDGITSWTNKSAYWPELLTHDPTFDNSDIFVYSYPTGLWATLSIDELADNMYTVLNANGISKYSKIIFLSHSMGGVVTRAYLLKYREIAERTAFAYFFATPTTGSEAASILRWALNNPQVEELRSMKPQDYLANLIRGWLDANFSFPSYCAYETKPTDGVMLLVSMGSAAPLCTRGLVPIDADHTEIVKPEDKNSPSYYAFKSAYRTVQSELQQKMAPKEAPASPMSDSLVDNTGTILNNKVDHNFIINGRPEQLTITSNSGKINSNTITDNFVDGNIKLLRNSGIIDQNEVAHNTVMGHQANNNNAPPFHVIYDSPPVREREGTFTCSFRIQMETQTSVDYLTVALEKNELLDFSINSDPRAVWLNPFVGYIIAKVNHPGGVLTVWGRYSKAACNQERRFSWGKNVDWQATSLVPK
jgi:pimeloyl-ACP methyl ester carboxylesterase